MGWIAFDPLSYDKDMTSVQISGRAKKADIYSEGPLKTIES